MKFHADGIEFFDTAGLGPTTGDMQMHMMYCLDLGPDVHEQLVAILNAQFFGYFSSDLQHPRMKMRIVKLYLFKRRVWLFGNHEKMNRCHWIDVVDDDELIILKLNRGRELSIDDLGKN